MQHIPLEGVGDWVTLDAAARTLGLTYWQVRHIVRKHRIQTGILGKTTLIRLGDLRPYVKEGAAR